MTDKEIVSQFKQQYELSQVLVIYLIAPHESEVPHFKACGSKTPSFQEAGLANIPEITPMEKITVAWDEKLRGRRILFARNWNSGKCGSIYMMAVNLCKISELARLGGRQER